VTEELALHAGGGDGGAVDGEEAGPLAVGVLVDGVGDEFLSGSRLAVEKDGGPGGGYHSDLLEEFPHGGRGADDVLEAVPLVEPGLQLVHLHFEAAPFHQRLDPAPQLVEVHRLGEVVVGAHLHGFHSRFHRPEGGDQQDRQSGIVPLDPPEDLHAVHAGHPKVRDHEVDSPVLLQVPKALHRVGKGVDLEADLLEGPGEAPKVLRLVLQDEERSPCHSGIPSVPRLPFKQGECQNPRSLKEGRGPPP
jgi:hypothetical protein